MTAVMLPHWSAQKESCLDVRSFKELNTIFKTHYKDNQSTGSSGKIKKPHTILRSNTDSGDECISEESTQSNNDRARNSKNKEVKSKEGNIYCVSSFQSYVNGMIV